MKLAELKHKLVRAQKCVHSHSADALALAKETATLAQELSQPQLQAAALCICARAAFNFGHCSETLTYLEQIGQITLQHNVALVEGCALELYARTQYTLGAYAVARDSWTRCLTLPDEAIDLETRVKAHVGLGQLYYAHEHYQTALAHHRKAEDLAASSEDYHLQGTILINIAVDLIACEQLDEAHAVLKDALPLVKADQSYRNEAEIYMQIGRIKLLRGDLERAKISLMVALKINRLHIHQWSEASTQLYLGQCHLAAGEFDHASIQLHAALKTSLTLGAVHLQAYVHQALADLYTRLDQPDVAAEHTQQYQSLREQLLNNTLDAPLETMELPLCSREQAE